MSDLLVAVVALLLALLGAGGAGYALGMGRRRGEPIAPPARPDTARDEASIAHADQDAAATREAVGGALDRARRTDEDPGSGLADVLNQRSRPP